jgi:hypothetical protein
MDSVNSTTLEREFVFRRLEEALRFFGRETDAHWVWIVLLLLVLPAAFFYVARMYRRDSRSVGWIWATFLGVLRCAVYLVLACVFLLPAMQTWEKTETRSKVVLAIDVSGSMGSKDDQPSEAMPAEKLPTRQEKVIQFLNDDQTAFLKNLLKTNPVYVYRFGSRADEDSRIFNGDKPWSSAEWSAWLQPNPKEVMPEGLEEEEKTKFLKQQELHQQLVSGTNLGDSLLQIGNRELNNMVQGIVVISDGRNTQYSSQAFEELRARLQRAKVPIFAVAVGELREQISIRVDMQAPQQARPDDKFPVRVEVDGEGLPNREMVVHLDVTSPKGEKRTVDKAFKFNAGSGGPPHAQIEFEIGAAEFGKIPAGGKVPELEEGEWIFLARVPKEKREIFLGKEHVSNKGTVSVVKKPVRILLFAGAATHEYQFVRNLLVREVDQHRAELSICLQAQREKLEGIVQDVPSDRLLRHFPNRLDEAPSQEKAQDRYMSLAQYDLIIAFDPDWSQLQPEELAVLEKWVSQHAGGLVLVAGPVNTYQLARPTNRETLKPLLDLFPVVLQDSRLQGLGLERPTTEPWRLNFPGATADMEFLKLDEDAKEPLGGWEEFFTGKKKNEETSKDTPIMRGFYTYYPVDSVKPSAVVVATFSDPRARLRDSPKEQPFLATMPYGSGKVVYIGSGEMWRLRQCREVFHERFWTKLARYAGSGSLSRLSRHGVLVMGREFTAGQLVHLEAQLWGRDGKPLSRNASPKIQLKPPSGVTMTTSVELKEKKEDDWNGRFEGSFRVTAPGEYRLELQIPETGDTLLDRFTVKESNPELDNSRPDFTTLYRLASPAEEVLPRRTDKQDQDELKQALEGTAARLLQHVEDGTAAPKRGAQSPRADSKDNLEIKESVADNKDMLRLLFDLGSASLIPKWLLADSKIHRSRGPTKDLWDQGFDVLDPSVRMATVLLVITVLLSIEWLTRKLLKLA